MKFNFLTRKWIYIFGIIGVLLIMTSMIGWLLFYTSLRPAFDAPEYASDSPKEFKYIGKFEGINETYDDYRHYSLQINNRIITGVSMENGINNGDIVLIEKIEYIGGSEWKVTPFYNTTIPYIISAVIGFIFMIFTLLLFTRYKKDIDIQNEINKNKSQDAEKAYAPETKTSGHSTSIIPPSSPPVEVQREWEYFGGSIRLKVAIINRLDSLIVDVRLRPVFSEEAFILDRVEPSTIPMKDGEAYLGNVKPREKRTCAIYLDPLICTTSDLEAFVYYRDTQGCLQTLTITPVKIPVACPIFFTPEAASVASVRNLVDNVLERKDSKVYMIPPTLEPSKVFTLAKEVVQMHPIRHVKDFAEANPWRAEGWYYGLTKDNQRPFVIVVRVFGDNNTIALMAYAESAQNICGLLADIHTGLNKMLLDARYITQPIKQITNVTIRDSVINRSTILSSSTGSE
jgi:hypothetical protein